MKFNFGHGILVVILSFMGGMSWLVYKCSQQRVDLVSPGYYEQELKYNEQISKEKNTLALNQAIVILFEASTREVVLKFPFKQGDEKISGQILFFKPDNTAFDFNVPVKVDANHAQQINASKLPHGVWRVKVNWEVNNTPYYNEEKIFIN